MRNKEQIEIELAEADTADSRMLLGVISAARGAFVAADAPGGPIDGGVIGIAVPAWAIDAIAEALSGDHEFARAFEDMFGATAVERDGADAVHAREVMYHREWPELHSNGDDHASEACPACHIGADAVRAARCFVCSVSVATCVCGFGADWPDGWMRCDHCGQPYRSDGGQPHCAGSTGS